MLVDLIICLKLKDWVENFILNGFLQKSLMSETFDSVLAANGYGD